MSGNTSTMSSETVKFHKDLLEARDFVAVAHRKLEVLAQNWVHDRTHGPTGPMCLEDILGKPGPMDKSVIYQENMPMPLQRQVLEKCLTDELETSPRFLPGSVWTPPPEERFGPTTTEKPLHPRHQAFVEEPDEKVAKFVDELEVVQVNQESQPSWTETASQSSALDLKGRIKAWLVEPEPYNVSNLYHHKGHWQSIARSQIFEQITLLIICLNALWIWVDTDQNKATLITEAEPQFQVMENFFCFFFSLEWLVRFMSFKSKYSGFMDRWFFFDTILVFLMVLETWILGVIFRIAGGSNKVGAKDASILRILRLLRLSRMARMTRLFRAVPELLVMMKGIAAATRSVVVTLTLLALIIYVFGVTFRQLLDGTEPGRQYFPTVADSMLSLIFYGIICENTPDVVLEIGQASWISAALLFVFILLASFTVLNMLIGVMCETVHIVSTTEHEIMQVSFTREKLGHMLKTTRLDENNDEMISKEEFKCLLQIPEACHVLRDLGVDVLALVDAADIIFERAQEIDYATFMQVVMQMRDSNTATVRDLILQRRYIQSQVDKIGEMFEAICDYSPTLKEKVKRIAKNPSIPAFREAVHPNNTTRLSTRS